MNIAFQDKRVTIIDTKHYKINKTERKRKLNPARRYATYLQLNNSVSTIRHCGTIEAAKAIGNAWLFSIGEVQ